MALRNIAASLAALALFSAPTWAQLEPDSEPISLGPLGGSAISIVVDPADADTMLMIRYTEGIFRTTDGAVTFDAFGAGIGPDVRDMIHDPADPQGLYAWSPSAISHSSDFGANWTTLPLTPIDTFKGLAVAPNGLLAVEAFDVHHSSDDGANWTVVASFVPFSGDVFADAHYSADGSVAYISTFDGILRSADGGATFSNPNPSFTEWVQAMDVDPTDADTLIVGTPFNDLFRSVDGGASWAPSSGGVAVGNAEWFARDPGGQLWYATLSNLYVSTNGGTAWSTATSGWPTNTPIPSTMGFAPTGQRYLGCEGGGLFDQSGGGLYTMPPGAPTTWEHIGFLVARINDVAVAGPGGTRVVGIGGGVYAGDPGDPPTPTEWHADIGTDTRTVAVDPADADRWVTGGVGAFLDNAQIVVVTDGGDTFVKTYENLGSGTVTDLAFDPHFAGRLIAGMYPASFGNEAIILSTDNGNNWSDVPGTSGWATRAVAYDPHTPGRILQLSENNQWSESTNGGSVWLPLQPAWPASGAAMLLVFDPFVAGRIYRGDTGSGLWLSEDDGGSWVQLGVGLSTESDVLCHPDIPGTLWVSNAAAQILVSVDSGNSFAVALDVPQDENGAALAIDTATGNLLVGTDGSALWELPGGSPTVVLDGGTAGTGGFVPRIAPAGSLPSIGSPLFAITGEDIVGGATVFLVLGITEVSLPVFGGTFRVGSIVEPIVAFPAGGTPGVGGAGSFYLPAGIPNNPILVGLPVLAQLGVSDAGAAHPSGKVLSNALRITIIN
jgi:hypothetical protein